MKLSKVLKNGCITLSCFMSLNVLATETTWEWDLSVDGWAVTQNDGSAITPYNSISVDGSNTDNGGTLSVDMSAWADTGANGQELESSTLYFYDNASWGAVNDDEIVTEQPEHSFDNIADETCRNRYSFNPESGLCDKNRGGGPDTRNPTLEDNYDMALFSFETSVELTDIDFGYAADGDFTLVAYTGAGSVDLAGETWASIADSDDWLTIGQYNGEGTGYYSVNDSGISSEYWLIGAYNSQFGDSNADSIDSGNDAFKIKKLMGISETGTVTVSAPATLGMLLASSVFCYNRRRKVSLAS